MGPRQQELPWGLGRIHIPISLAVLLRDRRLGLGISNICEPEETVMCYRNVGGSLDSILHYFIQLYPPFQSLIQKWNNVICQEDFRTLPINRLHHLTSCEVTSPLHLSQVYKNQGLGNVKTIRNREFENRVEGCKFG